jgi:hypothetical protein
MAGKLSFLQEEALIALHFGRRGDLDPRAVRGLVLRGLVERSDWVLGDHLTLPDSPALTTAGAPIAAQLAEARRARAQMVRLRGTRFAVIEGGLA